jgi:hypothetical protein
MAERLHDVPPVSRNVTGAAAGLRLNYGATIRTIALTYAGCISRTKGCAAMVSGVETH